VSAVVNPSYPLEIEAWWLQQILQRFNLKSEQAALKVLAPYADQLSKSFTSERTGDFKSCYESKQNQLAYGIYFFPQTYVRTLFPVAELLNFRKWQPSCVSATELETLDPVKAAKKNASNDSSIQILDLGSGAGAAGFAAALALNDAFPEQRVQLTLVDQEKHLLNLADNLHRDVLVTNRKNISVSKVTADFTDIHAWKSQRHAAWDLITLSFSLNEAFTDKPVQEIFDWLQQLRHCLKPGGIILMLEPSLKESSERLEHLRNLAALDEKWHIWGPCLHRQTCPLLANKKFWCHEVKGWKLPRSVQMINNHMRRTPEDLKFSFLMLGSQAPEVIAPSPSHLRLIAPIAAMHGKLLTSGCNSAGEAAEYDFLTRHLDRPTVRQLTRLERGSVVDWPDLKVLGGKHQYRVQSIPQ